MRGRGEASARRCSEGEKRGGRGRGEVKVVGSSSGIVWVRTERGSVEEVVCERVERLLCDEGESLEECEMAPVIFALGRESRQRYDRARKGEDILAVELASLVRAKDQKDTLATGTERLVEDGLPISSSAVALHDGERETTHLVMRLRDPHPSFDRKLQIVLTHRLIPNQTQLPPSPPQKEPTLRIKNLFKKWRPKNEELVDASDHDLTSLGPFSLSNSLSLGLTSSSLATYALCIPPVLCAPTPDFVSSSRFLTRQTSSLHRGSKGRKDWPCETAIECCR